MTENSSGAPTKCPICDYPTKPVGWDNRGNEYSFNCPRCGRYSIGRMALRKLAHHVPDLTLSAWIRNQKELKLDPPSIRSENFETIISNLPKLTPLEKQSTLLRAIERRTIHPGYAVKLFVPIVDFTLAWSVSLEEMHFHIDALLKRNLLKWGAPPTGAFYDETPTLDDYGLVITSEGWDFLEREKTQPIFSEQVFVAMSFHDDLGDTWEHGIKPAIEDAGYRPYRVDKEKHVDRIDAKIINEIRNSRFVVADVTLQRQGVYYEAGYAEGLGRKVMWSVRKDDLDNVHFDTRQFSHVVWTTPEELREQLYELICAVIGKRQK